MPLMTAQQTRTRRLGATFTGFDTYGNPISYWYDDAITLPPPGTERQNQDGSISTFGTDGRWHVSTNTYDPYNSAVEVIQPQIQTVIAPSSDSVIGDPIQVFVPNYAPPPSPPTHTQSTSTEQAQEAAAGDGALFGLSPLMLAGAALAAFLLFRKK